MLHVGIHSHSSASCSLQHTKVAEEAIYGSCLKFGQKQVLAQMSNQKHGEIPTTCTWWTNEMNYISMDSAEEKAVITDDGALGSGTAQGCGKIVIVDVKDAIRMVSLGEQTVFYPYADTFANTKASMLVQSHRRLVRCKIDKVCFMEGLVGDLEVFASQVSNAQLEIVAEEDVKATEKVLLSASDGIGAKPKRTILPSSSQFVSTEFLLAYIPHFLFSRFKRPSLYGMGMELKYLNGRKSVESVSVQLM